MRRCLLRVRSRSRSCKAQCEVTTENLVSQGLATLVFHQFQLAYCEHHGAAAALVAVAKHWHRGRLGRRALLPSQKTSQSAEIQGHGVPGGIRSVLVNPPLPIPRHIGRSTSRGGCRALLGASLRDGSWSFSCGGLDTCEIFLAGALPTNSHSNRQTSRSSDIFQQPKQAKDSSY